MIKVSSLLEIFYFAESFSTCWTRLNKNYLDYFLGFLNMTVAIVHYTAKTLI